jgi:hypothetical protein
MQDSEPVGGRQTRAELPRNLDRLVGGEPADAPHQRIEILAVDVLHRQVVPSVNLADVVDPADVRMRDPARHAHLVQEPCQTVLAALEALG